jgi:hypothetical protein
MSDANEPTTAQLLHNSLGECQGAIEFFLLAEQVIACSNDMRAAGALRDEAQRRLHAAELRARDLLRTTHQQVWP